MCEVNSSGAVVAVHTFGPYGLLARGSGANGSSGTFLYTWDLSGNLARRLDAGGNVRDRNMPGISEGSGPDRQAAPASAPSVGRTNNFDFLRFFLATMVVFGHCYPLLYGSGHEDPISRATRGQIGGGTAVGFFFLISGFLVTQSWAHSRGVGDYLRKRVLRIYPAFIGASLFCALVAGPLGAEHAGSYFAHWRVPQFVAYMALQVGPYLPPVFLHLPLPNAVDGSFWTLRYEFECYLLICALGLAGLVARREWPAALLALALVLSALPPGVRGRVFPDRDLHLLGNPSLWAVLAPFFLAGMVFYLYRAVIPYSPGLLAAALAGLVVAGLAHHLAPVLPVLGGYVLFYLAFLPGLRLQRWGRWGDFSYGVYLYSFPVQQLLIQYGRAWLSPGRLFFAAMGLTLVLAAASWYLVERPCLRLKVPQAMGPGGRHS